MEHTTLYERASAGAGAVHKLHARTPAMRRHTEVAHLDVDDVGAGGAHLLLADKAGLNDVLL
jgi:hypothetical protein